VRLFIDNPEGGSEKLLIGVPFKDIGDAFLVLTDELIAAAKEKMAPKGYGDGSEIDEDQITEEKEDDHG
jgi:ribosome maturation factor RimP